MSTGRALEQLARLFAQVAGADPDCWRDYLEQAGRALQIARAAA